MHVLIKGSARLSIFQLVNEISNGEIVLPAIQRDFVWSEDRIERLFDSLFRGYPVGIVLLWETYQPMQYRRFVANYRRDTLHEFDENKKMGRLKLVLDGQQRLSSIYVALKGSFEGRKLHFDVLSGRDNDDHAEEKYRFKFANDDDVSDWNAVQEKRATMEGAVVGDNIAYWLRFSDIVNLDPLGIAQLRRTIKDKLSLSAECETRLDVNLSTVLHALSGNSELLKTQTVDSNLPADDQKRKSAFDILEIFVRINTQGMPLRRSDLIVSMLRLYWPSASTVLPSLIKEINTSSGLEIDTDFVIRCMFSTAGLGTRLEFDLLRKRSNVDALQNTYLRTFESIRSVMDFVRLECGLDSSKIVGGISTLIPFVHYVFHAPGQIISKSSIEAARKSLFLFAFSRALSQHMESRTSAFIRDHLPSAHAIAGGADFPYNEAIKFTAWRGGFERPDGRLFANNLDLALAILHRRSGGKVYLAANIPEIDHIFPKSVLAEKGYDSQDINDIGNFWILPRKLNRNKSAEHPASYLKAVDERVLTRALIDREKLNYNQFKRFVRERRAQMVLMISKSTGLQEGDFITVLKDDDD